MRIESTSRHTYSYDQTKPMYNGLNSSIYVAIDETFNRRVCLKVIPYSGLGAGAPELIKRESVAMAQASSATNRVPVLLDFWNDAKIKTCYIVMQLISGNTLSKEMKAVEPLRFNSFMMSLCDTLGAVHSMHIYHKDVKPDNIIIASYSSDVYLIDFNISIGAPNLKEGTYAYRAPEMYHGNLSVARDQSDIFSLGVIMYEFYAGVRPEEGIHYGNDFITSSGKDWSYFQAPSALRRGIPPRVDAIIEKCMKKNPADRYRRTVDLKRDLKLITKELRAWNV